jgi:hypothetical protein
MLKNLSYKKKNKILLFAGAILLLIIYNMSIKKTIALYSNNKQMKQKLEMAATAPMMANKLEKQLSQMERKIGKQNKTGQDQAQALLELVTNYCQDNKIVLREFPEPVSVIKGDLLISTTPFVVEGDFASLLKLVYLLEQKANLGKIASVHYMTKKDMRTKEFALTATIYIQNVKKNQNNNKDAK